MGVDMSGRFSVSVELGMESPWWISEGNEVLLGVFNGGKTGLGAMAENTGQWVENNTTVQKLSIEDRRNIKDRGWIQLQRQSQAD